MRKSALAIVMAAMIPLAGCASIPSEAPELSTQLGNRISALETSHIRLLDDFFVEKRRRVDEFVQQVWVPVFAEEFFNDPKIANVWQQVVQSHDPNDRLRFIVLVGPKLQEKINRKRVELIKPLDELQSTIKSRLESEYDQAKAANNTLTSFLASASKVEQNRERYLEMIGVSDQMVDRFIDETDQAVSDLTDTSRDTRDRVKEAEEYRHKLRSIVKRLQK